MPRLIHITNTQLPELEVYKTLTQSSLKDFQTGSFIVESPKVIKVALDAGYEPVSLLCEQRHIDGDAAQIIQRCGDIPIYTGEREVLSSLTGYTLTRGVLCEMRRQKEKTVEEVCHGARRIAVLESLADSTNIGAIFRSAAALGIDAVLMGHTCCDALNRRAVRVSMGGVFLVPWARLDAPVDSLRSLGFKTVAMALRDDAISLDDKELSAEPRLAIVLGSEGDGLESRTIARADYCVKIPMYHDVDSLNVAAAAAVAFYALV